MEHPFCVRCKKEREQDNFKWCSHCREDARNYHVDKREKNNVRNRAYHYRNRDENNQKRKETHQKNKESDKLYSQQYSENNRDKINAKKRKGTRGKRTPKNSVKPRRNSRKNYCTLLHFMQIWSKTIQRSRSQHEKSQTHQNYLKQQAEEEKTKEKPMEIHRLKHLMPLAKKLNRNSRLIFWWHYSTTKWILRNDAMIWWWENDFL